MLLVIFGYGSHIAIIAKKAQKARRFGPWMAVSISAIVRTSDGIEPAIL
jgi:hypothetical protein